jgi:recombination protein RecA
VTFGSPETTTGGNALKYYASVRVDVRRIGSVKNGEVAIGNRTKVKVVKNKLAPPFQQVEFDIRFGEGVDAIGDLLDCAIAADVIEKNGSFFKFAGQSLGQGREKARQLLIDDATLRASVADKLGWAVPTPSHASLRASAAAEDDGAEEVDAKSDATDAKTDAKSNAKLAKSKESEAKAA